MIKAQSFYLFQPPHILSMQLQEEKLLGEVVKYAVSPYAICYSLSGVRRGLFDFGKHLTLGTQPHLHNMDNDSCTLLSVTLYSNETLLFRNSKVISKNKIVK